MSSPVDVIAVGARTPVGLRAEPAAAAIRGGISRVREHDTLVDGAGNPLLAARDPLLDAGVTGPARLIALGLAALTEVVRKLAEHGPLPGVLPVLLALPEPRPGLELDAVRAVARGIASATLPGVGRLAVEAVGSGHAGALSALEVASKRMAQGHIDLCVVGGIDSYLNADTLDWLEQEGRLVQEGVRGGFSPGEAAGMLAVATSGARASLRLPSFAQLRAVATAEERRSIDSPEGLLGEALSEAVSRATAGVRSPNVIDDVYCDINGERHRTDDWAFMVQRVPSVFRDGTAYLSAVTGWGDVGAASGALSCVLAVQAWRRQYATGRLALVCGSSDGGLRGAALLEQGEV